MEKKLIFLGIIILAVLGLIIFTSLQTTALDSDIQCIKENAKLYVQTGCPACDKQKQVLGEDYESLNPIDCKYENQKCSDAGIRAIPTWIINNEQYTGVRTIEQIKELTSC